LEEGIRRGHNSMIVLLLTTGMLYQKKIAADTLQECSSYY
jgi:hypothetical protein